MWHPVKAVAIGIVAAVVAVASGERATSAEIKAGELLKADGGAEGTAQRHQRITAVAAKDANPPATP